jgi:hypothetical protein
MRFLFVIGFCLFVSSPVFSQSETLFNINTSLDELERTLLDMESENESLKGDTAILRQSLLESEAAADRLLLLSTELRRLSSEQGEVFRRQSVLLEKSGKTLSFWRVFSLIAGAALLAAGVLVLLVN